MGNGLERASSRTPILTPRRPISPFLPASLYSRGRRIKSFSDPEKRKESIADQTVMQFNWHDRRKEKGEGRKEGRKEGFFAFSTRTCVPRIRNSRGKGEKVRARVYEWEHLKGEEAARARTSTPIKVT